MFQFQIVEYIYLLPIVFVLVGLFYLFARWRKSALLKLADQGLIERLTKGGILDTQWVRFGYFALAMTFALIALSNPQWGNKQQRVKAKSSDIVIALDISQSMMAQDILPNRMERAKRFTERLINSLKGERIALISFAGNAYLQMPLTSDYAAAEIFAKSANPSQAGTQGTAIADAIDLAKSLFAEDDPYQKALIIISDGESHDSEAIAAAEEAARKGIFIFTIGVGTTEGSMIPVRVNGKQQYKTDRSGNAITTALNKAMITDLADAGNGNSYFLSQSNSIVDDIKSAISKMEKKEVQQASFTDYTSYYQYFLVVAIALFILYFVQREFRKSTNEA